MSEVRPPDCDAGAGVCGRRSAACYGSISVCREHLDVLLSGMEMEAASKAVYFVREWTRQPKEEATPYLDQRLSAMLEEATKTLEDARASHAHYLQRAGDDPPDEESE